MPNFWLQRRAKKEASKRITLLVKNVPAHHNVIMVGLSYVVIDPMKPTNEVRWSIKDDMEILGYAVVKEDNVVWVHIYSGPLIIGPGNIVTLKLTDEDLANIKQL
jgi:hypothetical protein